MSSKYETKILDVDFDFFENEIESFIESIPSDKKIHSITPIQAYHGYTKMVVIVLERVL